MSGPEEVYVCRCREVTRNEIREAIASGAHDPDSVKRITKAGMGLCQGRTCQTLVAALIHAETGKPMAEIKPPTSRPPLRPIPARILAETETG